MSAFFKIARQMFTLALLWGFIGVAGYGIFSTLTASPGNLPMTSIPAFPDYEAPDSSRPFGLPVIKERHLAANASLYAEIHGSRDMVFNGLGEAYVLTETGDIHRLKAKTGKADTVPYVRLATEKSNLSIGFRSIALHPGFLDPESRGFGRLYTIEPEIAGTKVADFKSVHGVQLEHHQEVLVEYQTNDPAARVFSGSRREVLRVSQPGHHHNLNSMSFDRAGRLYLALGDGARQGESAREGSFSKNAMELDNVFGKILRIDPIGTGSANGNYGIPRRNPFRFLDEALPEIYAYGLRNPRHVDFDMFRNQLCITDTGADGIEEINLSRIGGEHFGWDLCEGSFFYPPSQGERPQSGVTPPTVELPATEVGDMMGSTVYTGHRFPELSQRLVFASREGHFYTARVGETAHRILLDNGAAITRTGIRTMRTGVKGELFVIANSGEIFTITKRATATKTVTGKVGRRLLAMTL